MATKVKSLPVVTGAAGAAVETKDLSAQKTIVVSGVQGTIFIEASEDGTNFCTAASFTAGNVEDQIVEISAAHMRVNAPYGGAATVCVVAEGGLARPGVIPLPPANGAGASLNISDFGPISTVYVNGVIGGTIGFEISCDGVNWSPDFKNFSGDGCATKSIDASYIRAVGNGNTGGVTAIGIVSDESPSTAISQPVSDIVYRYGATGADAPGGNVYVTESEARAAVIATNGLGTRRLLIDSRFSTHLNGDGNPACPFTLAWDFDAGNVILTGVAPSYMDILDGCTITDLLFVDGNLLRITYDGVTPGPIRFVTVPGMQMIGSNTTIFNTIPGAAPMFVGNPLNPFFFVGFSGEEAFGGIGNGDQALPAPIIDLNDTFVLFGGGAAYYADNAVTDTSVAGTGFLFWRHMGDQQQSSLGINSTNQVNYDFPALPATATVALQIEHRSRMIVNAVVPDTASPYQSVHNELVRVDTAVTPAPATVLLPDSHGIAMGSKVTVKARPGAVANAVTVQASGTDTVEGAATNIINVDNQARTYVIDGAGNWELVAIA